MIKKKTTVTVNVADNNRLFAKICLILFNVCWFVILSLSFPQRAESAGNKRPYSALWGSSYYEEGEREGEAGSSYYEEGEREGEAGRPSYQEGEREGEAGSSSYQEGEREGEAGRPSYQEGGSSSKENPLSKFKPDKKSVDAFEAFLKKKNEKKITPSDSSEPNEVLLYGNLGSMTLLINDILIEEGYRRINQFIIEPLLFTLKDDLYEDLSPNACYETILGDLKKNKKESILYKNLLNTGYLKIKTRKNSRKNRKNR